MRKLEKKMIDYLDKKLAGNGLAQEMIATKDARGLFILAAQACVGIRESGGNNKGPMVALIQDTVDGPDSWAWCMSFVMTCLAYAELKTGIKSPIVSGEHCMTVWNKTPKSQRVKIRPLPGAIAIWNYPPGQSGHTGILHEYENKPGKMRLFEGNTESGLTKDGVIQNDGGGVYHTERSTKGSSKMKLVGFLKPF